MSDKIWHNPLMWKDKKSDSDADDEFAFVYDFNKTEPDDIQSNFKNKLEEHQKHFSLAEAAAKAGEYKETTPQMGNIPNQGSQLAGNISKLLKDDNIDKTKPDYLLNIIWGNNNTNDIPPLSTLLEGNASIQTKTSLKDNPIQPNISIFNNDDEDDIQIAEKLGVKIDDIFDKGVSIGLSPLDIGDNVHAIRSAIALKDVTGSKLDSQNLTKLYQASLNNDMQTSQSILNNNNITLNDDISLDDIMKLSQSANSRIFKSIYLN